jgi:hypothetical protein
MRTTILAYVIAFAGLVTILAGAWGFYSLVTEISVRVPRRYYAIAIHVLCSPVTVIGAESRSRAAAPSAAPRGRHVTRRTSNSLPRRRSSRLTCGAPAFRPGIASPRGWAFGRKVSDEFTVPLCRLHDRRAPPLAERGAAKAADTHRAWRRTMRW